MHCLFFNMHLKGSSEIFEICRQEVTKKLSLLDQMPSDWVQQQTEYCCPVEGLQHSGLLSSQTTLQNQIFICDTGIIILCGSTLFDTSMVAFFWCVYSPIFCFSSWTEDFEGRQRIWCLLEPSVF